MERQRITYHSFFWLLIYTGLVWLEVVVNGLPFRFALLSELVRIGFYLILVYTNIYVLIPRYLNTQRLLTYAIGLLVLLFTLSPLMIRAFFYLFQAYPDVQAQIMRNQAGYYLLNFLILTAFTLFKIVSDWVRTERESRNIRTETMQSELLFLRSQINPHFLFNTLNSLYALTIKKSDLAPEMVLRLSDMMRYMLYECNEQWVPLHREITYMENYLELERLRHGSRADVRLEVDGHPEQKRIAPLIFIPFLENSFKHGISRSINQGFVHAALKIEANHIHFQITNSKPDRMPLPEGRQFGGIGLSNVRKRLEYLYPGQYQLTMDDDPLEYRVSLELDLHHEQSS